MIDHCVDSTMIQLLQCVLYARALYTTSPWTKHQRALDRVFFAV